MERTRPYWAVVGLGGFLAIGAVVLAQPALIAGTALLWGWLLARQYRFIRASEAAFDGLSVTLSSARTRVVTDTTTTVTMEATVARETPVDLVATAQVPVSATDHAPENRTLQIDAEHSNTATFTVEWPIAGEFELGSPIITATDPYGLFRRQLTRDDHVTITVDPRRPHDVHVGQGSDAITAAYGEHDGGILGSGIEMAEIREYLPGDDARQIDWKATARLNYPHVREQEPETGREVALVVDHRSSVAAGRAGETKFDYLRHVALAFVDTAQQFNDAIGLYGVGDDGLTSQHAPRAEHGTYAALRDRLQNLTPTPNDEPSSPGQTADAAATPTSIASPRDARRAADHLAGDDSAFSRTLTPFFEDAATYVQRIDDDPLFHTMRTLVQQHAETTWVVIFTDDTRRAELQETVKVARQGGTQVMVFLAPSVFFNQDGLTDLNAAYRQYVDFEEFRQTLTSLDRVTAFEVAPQAKLETVLANNRRTEGTRQRSDRVANSESEIDGTEPPQPTE